MAYRVPGRRRSSGWSRQPASYTWPAQVAGFVLLLMGAAVVAYWVRFTFSGNMPGGYLTIENGSYIAVHQAAEYLAALLAVTGGLGLIGRRRWGMAVALAALGALLYASINALAYSLVSAPGLTPFLGVALGMVLLLFVALHFGQER